jgi:tetratricopeptide (TPR) repeat protein
VSKINWKDLLGWGPDEMQDIRFVGYSYIKQGLYDAALKFFEALIVLTEENVYDLQTLGALYLQTGDNLSALNYFERALKLNATHEPTLLNRAKALFLLGYKKQALTQASQLIQSANPAIADQARALTLAYS